MILEFTDKHFYRMLENEAVEHELTPEQILKQAFGFWQLYNTGKMQITMLDFGGGCGDGE